MLEQVRASWFPRCLLLIITAHTAASADRDLRPCDELLLRCQLCALMLIVCPVEQQVQGRRWSPARALKTDYYYQYTECDSTGSRWRVAIPLNPASCSDLPPPSRGTDCCDLLLPSWDVFRDVYTAVHAMCGRLLFAG
ncbi:hypothetical protein PAMP_015154 [Pampus punctatissimus]